MLLTFGRKAFHFVTAKYRYSPTVLQFNHTTMGRSRNGESLYTLTCALYTILGIYTVPQEDSAVKTIK